MGVGSLLQEYHNISGSIAHAMSDSVLKGSSMGRSALTGSRILLTPCRIGVGIVRVGLKMCCMGLFFRGWRRRRQR
eukprot:2547787-Pyramimonas_sp.AAC.1